jgi:hypothetical protein
MYVTWKRRIKHLRCRHDSSSLLLQWGVHCFYISFRHCCLSTGPLAATFPWMLLFRGPCWIWNVESVLSEKAHVYLPRMFYHRESILDKNCVIHCSLRCVRNIILSDRYFAKNTTRHPSFCEWILSTCLGKSLHSSRFLHQISFCQKPWEFPHLIFSYRVPEIQHGSSLS